MPEVMGPVREPPYGMIVRQDPILMFNFLRSIRQYALLRSPSMRQLLAQDSWLVVSTDITIRTAKSKWRRDILTIPG